MRIIRTLRDRSGEDTGTTLIELMVSMAILGVVMAIFLGVLAWVQTAMGRETIRSTTEDQARLAIEAIDRDVRSGNILYDPASETPTAYYGFHVYTQSNAAAKCVQYRVQSQSLLKRTWDPQTSSPYYANVSSWRTVAENIVNSGTAASDRPFQLDTSAAAGYGSTLGSRVVNVTFVVNAKPGSSTSKDVRLTSSMSIRNQSSGTQCSTVPAG